MNSRAANYRINNKDFRVIYGDITQLTDDALVSSDDNILSMGGGVSRALLMAGGEVIANDARKHIPLKLGDVVVTSAGKLSAKYIFHAVTIDFTNMLFASQESIQAITRRCLQLADALGVRLMAFPALGTGVAGFPFQLAAEVMTRTIADHLMGKTGIERVTIALFAREHVKESDLNLYYERSVALASVSSQAEHLNVLLGELAIAIGQMSNPSLSRRVSALQAELEHGLTILSEKPETFEQVDEIQVQSRVTAISARAIDISGEIHEVTTWEDKQLEAKVLRTKLDGLLTQLNIQISNLNRFQIEKAKYGGQLVPPRLEIAIEDMSNEIAETEAQVKKIRTELIQLTGKE